jgi:hypothetical protein
MSRAIPWRRFAAAALALSLSALMLGAAGPAAALECPTPQPGGHDILREGAPAIAELSSLLGSGDLDNRVPDIVAGLRRRYPDAPAAEIVNYLVTVYCPVVAARADLDEAGKRARLDTFASQVLAIAARP